MLKKRFTKEDIYEFSRGIVGPWQERWYSFLGESITLSLSDSESYASVIVLSEGQETLPQTIYIKRGESFCRLDHEVFEGVRGEGNFVGKVRLPVGIQVEISVGGGGVVGTIHQRKIFWKEVGYTRKIEVREWISRKEKFHINFKMEWVSVYGEAWERFFEVMEKMKKERERSRLIEVGRKWCMERGLKVKHEEVYLLAGESILEEKLADELREDMELRRLLGVLEVTEEYSDFDSVFYVGPDRVSFRFKKGRFVYGMLNLLFTNNPIVLLEHISL